MSALRAKWAAPWQCGGVVPVNGHRPRALRGYRSNYPKCFTNPSRKETEKGYYKKG